MHSTLWAAAVLALSLGVSGCASVAKGSGGASQALPTQLTQQTPLARLAQQALGTKPPTQASTAEWQPGSAAVLLPRGLESLSARIALIEQAERSLDLQYYIWRNDTSGQGLLHALWQAAERGVRVRLLLDDWGARPSESALGQLASHPNIEVRLFNPIALRWPKLLGLLLDFQRGNRRMHNKAMVADNQLALLGGRNIADEYFERRADLEFGDLDVLLAGRVVRQISNGFDTYWNSPEALPVPANPELTVRPPQAPVAALWQDAAQTGFTDKLREGTLAWQPVQAQALQDRDDKVDVEPDSDQSGHLGHQLSLLAGPVKSELLVVSPYFVPGEGGTQELTSMAQAGQQVTIVTNSLAATDVPAVHGGYAPYRKRLLQAGVKLYEVRPDAQPLPWRSKRTRTGLAGSSRVSLHAKAFVMDRRLVFIGSMNIDPRSLRSNTENGVLLHSPALAQALQQGIEQALVDGAYRVELDATEQLRWVGQNADGSTDIHHQEPQADWWRRLQQSLSRFLKLEKLL